MTLLEQTMLERKPQPKGRARIWHHRVQNNPPLETHKIPRTEWPARNWVASAPASAQKCSFFLHSRALWDSQLGRGAVDGSTPDRVSRNPCPTLFFFTWINLVFAFMGTRSWILSHASQEPGSPGPCWGVGEEGGGGEGRAGPAPGTFNKSDLWEPLFDLRKIRVRHLW